MLFQVIPKSDRVSRVDIKSFLLPSFHWRILLQTGWVHPSQDGRRWTRSALKKNHKTSEMKIMHDVTISPLKWFPEHQHLSWLSLSPSNLSTSIVGNGEQCGTCPFIRGSTLLMIYACDHDVVIFNNYLTVLIFGAQLVSLWGWFVISFLTFNFTQKKAASQSECSNQFLFVWLTLYRWNIRPLA